MAIKIIGLDLDGTLLNSVAGISQRNIDVLGRAAEAGVHIIPVTGRPLSGLPESLSQLKGMDGVIFSNGASVMLNGETVITHHFSADICAELLKRFEGLYDIAEVFTGGMGYEDSFSFRNTAASFEGTPIMEYFRKSRTEVDDMSTLLSKCGDVEELAVMFTNDENCEAAVSVLREYPNLKYARLMPKYLEIMAADGGKGTALLELGRLIGADKSEIMAIGDSANDLDMLEKVGFPVAMGNASDIVKKASRYVTEDNLNDGVAAAVEKFVLNTAPAVIFLDVDGTIIDENSNIPPSAREAIRLAQEKGNICVVNTGRPYANVIDEVKALGVKGFICSCGEYISIDGEVIQNYEFTVSESQALIKKAKECRIDLFIESEHGLNYSFVHPISERMNQEFDRFRRRGFDVDAPVETDSFYFSKFCAWEYEDSDVESFMSFASDHLYPIRKEGRMYEMVRNGCSKAKGMESFIEKLSLQGCETYAVGDSGNDVEMLSSVMHGIAMGGAPDSLKAQVEYVTADLWDDGLYKAFEHYRLI